MKLIQKGNSKLSTMYMFNLPANKEVCGRTCRNCYAIREQQRYPTVEPARQSRYEASLQLDFANTVIQEISSIRKKPKYFRVHASGEFYDSAYISKWHKIAKSFPDIVFYTYTKRLKNFDFSQLKSLPNFVVIDSFHYGRLNYGPLDKAPANAVICPHQKGASIECGVDCIKCMSKTAEQTGIYFKKH